MNEIPNEGCEWVGGSKANEDKYVFYVTLPTLQQMAVNRVALAVWCSYISRTKSNEFNNNSNDDLWNDLGMKHEYWEECTEIIESLKTPRPIQENLKTSLKLVSDEIRSCIKHFKYSTISQNLKKYRITRFDVNWCVWLQNGEIDYSKTGQNMLLSSELNNVQKFAIMCKFCMENEIVKFSLRSLPESFVEQVNFSEDGLMYYWINYLKNDWREFPFYGLNPIELTMALQCSISQDCIAFEYFWNRLGDDFQVPVAFFRWEVPVGRVSFLPKVFSKMSRQNQRDLLSKIPHKIMSYFWTNFKSRESVKWTWKHSKDLMTAEQFAQMISEVLFHGVEFEEDMSLLKQIWNTASDQQRNYVNLTMKNEIDQFFSKAN